MERRIMAIVTAEKSKVSGGIPIFIADKEEDVQPLAFKLEKILDAMAHDLENGTILLVKH
ncbi:capping complex subunit for YIEGIA [Paenibacillus senegalensis]|uniref:capping complex subunit for YIEGIA n=1 Tax=Paenibacillus senegalensis TaxID=1465766 RepID=UPI00028835F9|nr:hypothetical protein [Paenibacillus senegalensis]